MDKIKKQATEFKKLMDSSFDLFSADDDEMIDKFYESEFTVTYTDKTSNTTAKMEFGINPDIWYMFESFVKNVIENADDYE